jgi:predicted membrane GTPase involved in stress response
LSFILDQILESVPSPKGDVNSNEFRLLVTQIGHDKHLGKMVIGRVMEGKIKLGDSIYLTGP